MSKCWIVGIQGSHYHEFQASESPSSEPFEIVMLECNIFHSTLNEPGHLETLKYGVEYKNNEVWTSEWAQDSIFRPHLLLSARSLSLSNGTGAHLAQSCGLNWIRHTRLFRHCVVAWESPSDLHEGRRKKRDQQHLSVDLRVRDFPGGKAAAKQRTTSLPLCPSSVPSTGVSLHSAQSQHPANSETLLLCSFGTLAI